MAQLLPFLQDGRIEAGCDEAGRGCLAGPVFAAAVILPDQFNHPLLNDSKQLTEHQRNTLRPIIEQEALAWCVGVVTATEIDEINILKASILATHPALDGLGIRPEAILVHRNRFKPYHDIPSTCIVKGDATYRSIAAASILAKTHRDEFMDRIAAEYPQYAWDKNKGYPTKAHRQAIEQTGPSPYHRMSFRLIDRQLKLF